MAQRWNDIKRRHATEEEIEESQAWAEREVLEMNLRAMRDLIGRTQEDLAHLENIAQGEISKVERRSDHLVSTLRRYVEALGGELEIIAPFNDKSIKLRGV